MVIHSLLRFCHKKLKKKDLKILFYIFCFSLIKKKKSKPKIRWSELMKACNFFCTPVAEVSTLFKKAPIKVKKKKENDFF